MNKMMFVIALIAYSLFGTESFAQQSIWPGSQCQRWSTAYPEPTMNWSAIYNGTGLTMAVDCPVERNDFSGFLHWPGIESAWVSVIDQNFSADARCWQGYLSVGSNGVWSAYSTASAYSSGTNGGAQRLYLPSMSLPNDEVHTFIGCTIPPTYSGYVSYLVNYYVNQ
jgi:hypothetical protein